MKLLNLLSQALKYLTIDSFVYKFSHAHLDDSYINNFKNKQEKKITIIIDEIDHIRFNNKKGVRLVGYFAFNKCIIDIQKTTIGHTFSLTFRAQQICVYLFLLMVFGLILYSFFNKHYSLDGELFYTLSFVTSFMLFFPRLNFLGLI